MKKGNEPGKKILKAAATAMIHREMYGWPPGCGGFSYQPRRPEKPKAAKG